MFKERYKIFKCLTVILLKINIVRRKQCLAIFKLQIDINVFFFKIIPKVCFKIFQTLVEYAL